MNRVIVYMLYFTLYTVFLLLWGKTGFKKTNTIRDFCVANNSLGLFTCIFTFTATWFSAVSMQSVTGSVYAFGYSTILYSVVGWFLGASCLVFAANRIRDYDIVTIPEYFKLRYNSQKYQAFMGLIIIISYILYIIIQIKGFGLVVSELLDINYTLSILLIYLFVVYTSFGGLFSVARTDTLNFMLVIVGVFLAAGYIVHDIGSITLMHEKAAALTDGALLDLSANNLFSPLMIFSTSLAWGLGTAANPQYLIRITSAKSKEIGMQMISTSVIIMGVLYLGLMVIGIGSRVLEPSIDVIGSIDRVLPYILNNKIYSNFSGIIFISILAAAISTANSQLLLLSSSFSYDIYMNLFNQKMDHEKFLTLTRLIIFVAGTISLLLSVNPPETLLVYGSYIWTIFAVTFLFPLYGGLYWKKATLAGAVWSSVGGIIGTVAFYLIDLQVNVTSVVHPVLPGLIIAFIIFYTVSMATWKESPAMLQIKA